MKKVIISLTNKEIKEIEEFAAARRDQYESTSRSRYQVSPATMEKNCKDGAAVEYAAYFDLQSNGWDVGKPDFSIHAVKNKRHDPDLTDGTYTFHCKATGQAAFDQWGAGWIFNKDYKLFKNCTDKDYLVVGVPFFDKKEVHLYSIVKVSDVIANNLLRAPDSKDANTQARKVKLDFNEVKTLPWRKRWGARKWRD